MFVTLSGVLKTGSVPWSHDLQGKSLEILKFLKTEGISSDLDQIFLSQSNKGVFRGFNFQDLVLQVKDIFLLEGEVDDYLLNLEYIKRKLPWKRGYLRHKRLSEFNRNNFLRAPKDYAHGYYVRSETALMLYLISGQYHPELQKTYNVRKDNLLRSVIESKSEISFDGAILSKYDW